MTIIDELNAKIERDRASDREVAKLAGITVAELDADTTALDTPVRGSVFNRFCTGFGITADRQLFHKFCKRRYARSAWTWSLLVMLRQEFYTWARQAMIDAADAADLHDTQADALV